MLPGYIIFIILITVLYAYTNENRQLAATASAIRDIWSGQCQLSCRRSEYSGLSDLSGNDRASRHATTSSGSAGPSHGCFCESCPCVLIRRLLRRCDPITEATAKIYNSISELHGNLIRMVSEEPIVLSRTYIQLEMGKVRLEPIQNYARNVYLVVSDIKHYISRESQCGISCHRQLQAPSHVPTENVPLTDNGGKNKSLSKFKQSLSKLRTASVMSKLSLVKKCSSVKINGAGLLKRSSAAEIARGEKEVNAKGSRSFIRINSESAESEQSTGCARCVENGKVCIGGCPKANFTKK